MELNEPVIEFIEFNENDVIITSGGAGVETCKRSAPMNELCTGDDFMFDESDF